MQAPANSTIVGIIPARLGSTRFPEKILASATGKPLIRHVWENARRATLPGRLVIATDHERIRSVCAAFGAEVVMTRTDHLNGTSRIAEAAETLALADDAVVVNIQGDEPELEPHAIDGAITALLRGGAEVGTIASPLREGQDPGDPAIVKVVLGVDGRALYFSRSLIPFPRERGAAPVLRHVGLYAYRVGFLKRYAELSPTPLERAESLEQLRVLEHGHNICVSVVRCEATGIDTPEQYAAFVARQRAAQQPGCTRGIS